MGNHEYCTACGENDFHMGRDCDPIKKEWHRLFMNGTLRKLGIETVYPPEHIKSLVGIDEFLKKSRAQLRKKRAKTA